MNVIDLVKKVINNKKDLDDLKTHITGGNGEQNHSHVNKTTIDKISADENGNLLYDNEMIGSAKEVKEAREDIDGVVHSSLKERVDSDVLSLKDEVVDISKEQGEQWDKINDATHILYEGTSIKAEESYRGRAINAKLKGKTLVNLYKHKLHIFDSRYVYSAGSVDFNTLKANTLYTIIVTSSIKERAVRGQISRRNEYVVSTFSFENGIATFTTNENMEYESLELYLYSDLDNPFIESDSIDLEVIILEGDYSNDDISYFEGMKSVGEETLKDGFYTVNIEASNKNLFDKNSVLLDGAITNVGVIDVNVENTFYTEKYFKIDGNRRIILSSAVPTSKRILWYDSEKVFISRDGTTSINHTEVIDVISPSNAKYFRLSCLYSSIDFLMLEEVQEGQTVASEYVERASNVVSIKSPVLLCEGNEIDLDNSKIYENTNRIILNGSETYVRDGFNDNIVSFKLVQSISKAKNRTICNSDKLPRKVVIWSLDDEGVCTGGVDGEILIYVKKEKITSENITVTVDMFKEWLSSNPLTVEYELATPIVHEITPQLNALETYEETTYINTDLLIKPNIKATIPTKTTTLFDREIGALKEKDVEHSKDILKIKEENFDQWDAINNATYIPYQGESIIADESYRGRAKEVKLLGKTVVDLEAGTMESTSEDTFADGFYTVNIISSNYDTTIEEEEVVEGEVAPSSVENVSNTVSIKSPILLCEGNEIDLDNNKIIENTKRTIFNGNQSYYMSSTGLQENTIIIYTFVPLKPLRNSCKCDSYRTDLTGWDSLVNNDIELIQVYVDRSVYIRILKSKLDTLDIQGAKKWISENPINFEYELETPIIHEISPSLGAIETYDEVTHITTDSLIKGEIECKIPSNTTAIISNLKTQNSELKQENELIRVEQEEQQIQVLQMNLEQDYRLSLIELGVK